jgi:myo-inositol 2-dehydrogenase/D-chiro-inositol 1-dehydrogenase
MTAADLGRDEERLVMRFALFGCGRIGKVHADSIAAHPQAKLAWACHPREQAARVFASEYSADASTDVDAVLADPRVDAIVVASPTPTHVDLVTRGVLAGKAVLCEKPIDVDITRVDACWQQIKSENPTVMMGFNRRFDPSFRAVRDRIRAGEVGRLEQLIIISRDPAPPPPGHVAHSGGLFRDMTIHDFDMARFLLGEVVEVQATGANLISEEIAAAGDVDSAVVVLRGADGALCHITNSRRCAFGYDQRIEAFGELGMLTAENLRPTGVCFAGGDATEVADPYLNFYLDRYIPAYRAELHHFIKAVETGTQPEPGFADGRAALALADAAGESLRSGRVVRVEASPRD